MKYSQGYRRNNRRADTKRERSRTLRRMLVHDAGCVWDHIEWDRADLVGGPPRYPVSVPRSFRWFLGRYV